MMKSIAQEYLGARPIVKGKYSFFGYITPITIST